MTSIMCSEPDVRRRLVIRQELNRHRPHRRAADATSSPAALNRYKHSRDQAPSDIGTASGAKTASRRLLNANHRSVVAGPRPAANAVEAALRQAGYSAERQDKTAGLAEVFEGMGDGLAEWIITTPDGAQLMLQMAYFDRGRRPVLMEFGPVLDLDDAIGGKVAALATRAAERDYLDVAAALARGYSVAQLTALALAAEDFAKRRPRLDRLHDDRFAPYGLTPDDVTRLRKQFAAWPRTSGTVPGMPPTGAP